MKSPLMDLILNFNVFIGVINLIFSLYKPRVLTNSTTDINFVIFFITYSDMFVNLLIFHFNSLQSKRDDGETYVFLIYNKHFFTFYYSRLIKFTF